MDFFDFLFHSFTDSFTELSAYHGYRLAACNGSALAIAYNPKDKDTHRLHNSVELKQKGDNQLHLNALYDLQNRIYLDAIVQSRRSPNEAGALIEMMKRSPLSAKTILIADRGYERYNIFAHAQEKDWKFLIRVKNRILSGVIIQQKKTTKYLYQVNFTVAVLICKQFYRGRIPPPCIEALIQQNVLPVREGRKAPRKVRPCSTVSFHYRVA